MSKISAVIITFNEERYIEECIRSVTDVADEIVVIDSLSTDKTPEICKKLGVRYIVHPFEGYRDQKNFALTKVSFDYVLSLDADETLSDTLVKSILATKQDLIYDGYKFRRVNRYFGKKIHHNFLFPEQKIRLFRKEKAQWGGYNIHETVILDDPKSVKCLKGDILHSQYGSYEERVDKMDTYSTISAGEYFRRGIKVDMKKLLFNPLWRFFHSYFIRGCVIDGYEGFVMSKILAFTCFLKYAKLRKLYIQARQQRTGHDHKVNKIMEDGIYNNNANQIPISIGFDAKRAFYNYSGLGNYSRNLLSAITKSFPGNSYYLFTPKTKNRIILENDGLYKLIEPRLSVLKLVNQLWRRKFIVNDIKLQKLNIYHGLSQELPLGIEKSGIKTVVTVHDLIFLRYPEFYKWIDAKIYYKKLSHACRVATHIVAISNQTKNDLVSFINIPPDKISVIHQGCNHYFWDTYNIDFYNKVKTKHNLPEKYLLYVGTIEERKNLLGLVKAMEIKNISVPLVVIGRKTDIYYTKVISYLLSHKVNNILFPENVLSNELPVIYQNAECFIYPSFFEGFGIPLLEALVSGTPVITSNSGCFSEAGGPGSLYIDPYNSEEIGEAILKLLNSKEYRDEMITVGRQYANNFSDDNIALTYMNLYHSLLK